MFQEPSANHESLSWRKTPSHFVSAVLPNCVKRQSLDQNDDAQSEAISDEVPIRDISFNKELGADGNNEKSVKRIYEGICSPQERRPDSQLSCK
jgi:hypothetical protein